MESTLLFFAILVFSSTSGSKISFCEDKSDDDIHLDLSNVGINNLRESFVTSSLIKCLNLADNKVSSIDKGAFEGLPELNSLDLSGNSIQLDNFDHLYEFEKLKTLILDAALLNTNESPLREEYNEYGDYDRRYGHRRTTTMKPKYWFRSDNTFNAAYNPQIFKELEKLSMCNHQSPEPLNWLSKFHVPNLSHLDLTGNIMMSDAQLTGSLTRNLTHLYLDDNAVSTFSGMNFPNLRHLSLNNNKIRRLCAVYCTENSMTPRAMHALENLSIEANEIDVVDSDAFVNSVNLLSLNLARNSIENFARHTFDNMTNLKNLTLDDNHFKEVPDICALTKLQTLSINGNKISSIDSTTFCNLPNLAFVSLRKNRLTTVESGTFGHLPGMVKLDMSWNDISSLPENWMRSGISLEELNLDANDFNDIASMSLGQFGTLGYLSIGRNPLMTMTVGSLINLPVNTTLDLARVCESKNDPKSRQDELAFTTTTEYYRNRYG